MRFYSGPWLFAALHFFWAVELLWPGYLTNSPAFKAMRDLAPESVWAAVVLVLGGVMVIGELRQSLPLRRIGLLATGMFWAFSATMFATAGTLLTLGWGTYVMIALSALALFGRTFSEEGQQEHGR